MRVRILGGQPGLSGNEMKEFKYVLEAPSKYISQAGLDATSVQ